ncbi:MAG: hypothetical protein VKJ64_00815 [Leptolyngbyaceae bacterium]|nr:hypothetical protein [Leptolyngbyaceae bacterium]
MTCYHVPSHSIDHPPFPPDETDQGLTETEPQVTPHHRRQTQGYWRVAIATSLTVPIAAAGALQVFPTSPNYEGRIQLIGLLPPSVSPSAPTAAAPSVLARELGSANMAPPDIVAAASPFLLQNPQMIAAVRTTLAQQGIDLPQQVLAERLSAQTTDQGWLELHYRDFDPERVRTVLAAVAQWYVSQVPTCDIQACDEVVFIETQLPIITQQERELQQTLAALQQTLHSKLAATEAGISGNNRDADSSFMAEANPIDAAIRHLATQHRDVAKYARDLDQTITETRNHLDLLQERMGLATVKPQSGFKLLHYVIPEYEGWLETWQRDDRHLLAHSLKLDSALSKTDLAERDQGKRDQRKSDLGKADGDRVEDGWITRLSQQQDTRLSQMNQAVSALNETNPRHMAAPLRSLLIEDVLRIGYMEEWLDTLHHLQLLELRRQTVTDFQGAIATQTEEWRQLNQTQEQLQRQLDTTAATLATYEEKYAIAQRQVNKHRLSWQMVAPPEIVQQPFLSGQLFSRLSHLAQPLMTLHIP